VGYTLKPEDSRTEDLIVFRLMTSQSDATLLRIKSKDLGTKYDFLKLMLEDGRPKLQFDVGGGPVVLKYSQRVDDGQYHQIQIIRNKEKGTIIVDDNDEEVVQGKKRFTVFNSQSMLEIGGLAVIDDGQTVIKEPFRGKILGLKFNGIRILDKAREAIQSSTNQNFKIVGSVNISSLAPATPTKRTSIQTVTSRPNQCYDCTKDSELVISKSMTDYTGQYTFGSQTPTPSLNSSSLVSNTTSSNIVQFSTLFQSPIILIITSSGAAVVIIIAIYVFYRYRSKPEIPAVVPGMGNNYKPGQQKKTAPPGKDTEYYV